MLLTCQICKDNVSDLSYTVNCSICNSIVHINCLDYVGLSAHKWSPCPSCLVSILPFNNIEDEQEFKSAVSCFSYLSTRHFEDLDIFSSPPLLDEPDFDETFRKDNQCKYYSIDSFNSSNLNSSTLSIFYMNAQSLAKKFPCCMNLIQGLSHNFQIYGFTETWFKDCVSTLYNIPHYSFIQKSRSHRKGGGVCLYLYDQLVYSIREDLNFSHEKIDTLFIEILSGTYM